MEPIFRNRCGHTYPQIAGILNEQKWVPLKGHKFTESSIGKLLRSCDETKHQMPKRYLEAMLQRMNQERARAAPDEPFQRPGLPKLAKLLGEAGYVTPKGHAHWWPAQVQQLLDGRFDRYYDPSPSVRGQQSGALAYRTRPSAPRSANPHRA